MLVTFTCDAHENITMFGDDALRLLKLMGHSGTVPSAIMAADVPAALDKLTRAIDSQRKKPQTKNNPSGDDDDEPTVSVVNRALPLLALLKDAVKDKCDIIWK